MCGRCKTLPLGGCYSGELAFQDCPERGNCGFLCVSGLRDTPGAVAGFAAVT
ncbi:MAG: hypothetical protein LBM98_04015 [Oscillospiraceae bacterium]|nr:hypothetical protein [Oscillospiraceae bacterium]